MSNTPIVVSAPTGLTLTLELYPVASDVIANTAGGDALTESPNRKGRYVATVTEAIAGDHFAVIKSGSVLIANGWVLDLADTTDEQYVGDAVPSMADAITPAIIAGVIAGLEGVQIVVPAGTTAGSAADFYLTQGDDYTGTRAIEIPVTSDADLSAYSLVFVGTKAAEPIVLVLPITGAVGSQVATLNPAGSVTKLWTVGTYTLQYKIRFAAGVEQTIKRGRLHVQAFATPAAA